MQNYKFIIDITRDRLQYHFYSNNQIPSDEDITLAFKASKLSSPVWAKLESSVFKPAINVFFVFSILKI